MYAEIISGEKIFDILADEWDDLVQRGMTDTPFQSLAYQKSWWQHLHPHGSELHSIVTRSDDHELIGIACLYITEEGVIHFNGCVEETDYLDLIVEADHAEQSWELIYTLLYSDDYPKWRLIELCNVPANSTTRTILGSLAEKHGHCIAESVYEVCPIIHLPNSFDAYLEMIDSKQRREIQRKLRRANAAGIDFHVLGDDEDLEQSINEFLLLLQKSTFEKRDWLNEGRKALFVDVARAAQAAGTLQLVFLRIQGENTAALFNFDYRDRIWVYNSGLDPTIYGNLSLGVVLTANAIEWAIEHNRSEFDFLRGGETYKYRFGAQDTEVYKIQVSRC